MRLPRSNLSFLYALCALAVGGCAEPGTDTDTGNPESTVSTSSSDSNAESSPGTSESTDSGETMGPGESTETTGEPACGDGYPAGPYGNQVGAIIENYSYTRGNGEAIELDAFHDEPPPALVIFSTASW